MQVPKIEKICINKGMGVAVSDKKLIDVALEEITTISGQKAVVIKARKDVANFKVREGYDTHAMVTLRGARMWEFFDRLISLAIPRVKDFRGLPDKSFDKAGNYSFGVVEQGIFPEINMAEATAFEPPGT